MDQLQELLAGLLLAAYQGDVESCTRDVVGVDDAEAALEALARLSSQLLSLTTEQGAPTVGSDVALWTAAQYIGAGFASRCSSSLREALSRVRMGVPADLELEGTVLQLAIRPPESPTDAEGGGPVDPGTRETKRLVGNPALPPAPGAADHPPPMGLARVPIQGNGGGLEKRIHRAWPNVVEELHKVKGKVWIARMLIEPWCVMAVEDSTLILQVPEPWIKRVIDNPDSTTLLNSAFERAVGQAVWVKFERRQANTVNPAGTITGQTLVAGR